MAIANPSPYAATSDLVSLREACDLLEETGRPVAPRTLKKHALAHKPDPVEIIRCGRTDYASWSDLLDVHAELYPD
jgi:hypothetical protein